VIALLEEDAVQRAVLEVLVHERLGSGVEAEAEEPDQVDVVGAPRRAHLRHELTAPPRAAPACRSRPSPPPAPLGNRPLYATPNAPDPTRSA
jgi:hypothetical protein